MIEKVRNPAFPQYLWEWHPLTGKVYLVRLGDPAEQQRLADAGVISQVAGEVVAEHCDTHARFVGFVQTWCRGYRERERVGSPAGV